MKLKENLKEIKKFLTKTNEVNKQLQNNQETHKIYRLYYINYHRIGENYGITGINRLKTDFNLDLLFEEKLKKTSIGMMHYKFEPFMFHKEMTSEEGFKVLSYLTDFIEKREDIEECSLKSVRVLDKALDIERFGFKRVEEYNEDEVLNLFTIDERKVYFKYNKLYEDYFEWYQENVTLEEVKNIYSKYNIEFSDLIFNDRQKEYQKVLAKNI